VFKPASTSVIVEEKAPIVGVDTLRAHDARLGSSENSYQALASKKPPPHSGASRSTKRKVRARPQRGAILIVDDVPDVTEMIGLLLKHAGYDVSTADSARSALQLARKNHYDLIISDIGMPEMNGYELAAALRSLTDYNQTPMIAVTGYSEYDDRGRAVKAGFNVHLTKPIEPAQLLNLMSELLSQSESGSNH
jgi:CheY-like chemotaxis protein